MNQNQEVDGGKAGCWQSAVSKHINGKLTGRENCGRRRCISNMTDRSFKRIIKKS